MLQQIVLSDCGCAGYIVAVKDREPSARFQNAKGFRKCPVRARHVAERGVKDDNVKALVLEARFTGIADLE